MNRIVDFCRKKEANLCYGAGEWGFYTFIFLSLYDIDIEFFIVSDEEQNLNQKKYLGKEVLLVDDDRIKNKNYGIILALNEIYHSDVRTKIKKYTHISFIELNETLIKSIKKYVQEKVYYDSASLFKYLKRIDIDLELFVSIYLKGNVELFNLFKSLKEKEDEKEFYNLKKILAQYPRFRLLEIEHSLFNSIKIVDTASFFSMYEEIFIKNVYKFECRKNNPIILDFGANIGLSVIFFARNYPNATIEAYEADPNIFRVLEDNIEKQNLKGIRLFNKAVWDKNEILRFYIEGGDGGHVEDNNIVKSTTYVEGVDVQDILKKYKEVDFLKMDIEGSEGRVISRCYPYLSRVKKVFVEYHSKQNVKQDIHQIINRLIEVGFRVYMNSEYLPLHPFYKRESKNFFDFQINILGIKE